MIDFRCPIKVRDRLSSTEVFLVERVSEIVPQRKWIIVLCVQWWRTTKKNQPDKYMVIQISRTTVRGSFSTVVIVVVGIVCHKLLLSENPYCKILSATVVHSDGP